MYTNADVVGCEVAGALKNVIAIASGMADGLGTGDNTRAAVITRGLAELTRLGMAMGGQPLTFSGLAGMGDLVATCISHQSRNRYVGEQLGKGRTIDEIVGRDEHGGRGRQDLQGGRGAGRASTAWTCRSRRRSTQVVHEGRSAADAYRGLLRRASGAETDGMG